jgi:hypothetical protein
MLKLTNLKALNNAIDVYTLIIAVKTVISPTDVLNVAKATLPIPVLNQ